MLLWPQSLLLLLLGNLSFWNLYAINSGSNWGWAHHIDHFWGVANKTFKNIVNNCVCERIIDRVREVNVAYACYSNSRLDRYTLAIFYCMNGCGSRSLKRKKKTPLWSGHLSCRWREKDRPAKMGPGKKRRLRQKWPSARICYTFRSRAPSIACVVKSQ